MKERIYKICNRKYPFQKRNRAHYLIALLLALWIFVFLWFPEPFELYRVGFKKKMQVIPQYSFFGGISYYLAQILQNFLFKKYNSWTLIFEATFLITALLLASVFMYTIYYFGINHYTVAYSYFKYIRLIYIPSLVIILPFIIISRVLSAYLNANDKSKVGFRENADVVIQGSGKFELLKLSKKNIIYIKSDNIYIDIFYEEKNEVNSQSIRLKLSEVEILLPELLKTHRSYLVNKNFFRSLKREDDKVFLELKYNLIVPVSRGKKENVLKHMPSATKG